MLSVACLFTIVYLLKQGWIQKIQIEGAEKKFGESETSLHTHNTWTSLGWLHNTTRKMITFKKISKASEKKGGTATPPPSPPLPLHPPM